MILGIEAASQGNLWVSRSQEAISTKQITTAGLYLSAPVGTTPFYKYVTSHAEASTGGPKGAIEAKQEPND